MNLRQALFAFARAPWVRALSVLNRIRSTRFFLGRGSANQIFFHCVEEPRDTILIIAPGEMRIPAEGWGAVEEIVWEQSRDLEARGYSVVILNSRKLLHWMSAFRTNPTIVVCHYDVLAAAAWLFTRFFRAKLVAISHFAYAGYPDLWTQDFSRIATWLSRADVFVALSEQIAGVFRKRFPKLEVSVIPNAVRVNDFLLLREPSRGVVFLGKVEPRKNQMEFLNLVKDSGLDVSFVGPIVDSRYSSLLQSEKSLFLGEWSRADIKSRLSQFSVCVLLSEAEADALVLYEAQAAGLSIVTNESAIGSQDPSLKWIYLATQDEEVPDLIRKATAQNFSLRGAIREHAVQNYDYDKYHSRWGDLILGLAR